MIKQEIKSNYLRVITDNEIIKEYRIPLDIEDISGNIKITINYLSNVNYGLKIKIFKENHEIFSGEVEGFFFRKVIIGNVFDAQLIILVEFYEEGFIKDLMINIESMNFVSINFNNEDIYIRGENYGNR